MVWVQYRHGRVRVAKVGFAPNVVQGICFRGVFVFLLLTSYFLLSGCSNFSTLLLAIFLVQIWKELMLLDLILLLINRYLLMVLPFVKLGNDLVFDLVNKQRRLYLKLKSGFFKFRIELICYALTCQGYQQWLLIYLLFILLFLLLILLF